MTFNHFIFMFQKLKRNKTKTRSRSGNHGSHGDCMKAGKSLKQGIHQNDLRKKSDEKSEHSHEQYVSKKRIVRVGGEPLKCANRSKHRERLTNDELVKRHSMKGV